MKRNTIINPTEREILVRVSKVSSKGAELLIYKDSRFDVNTLNDLYGVDGWNLRLEPVDWNGTQTVSATLTVRGEKNDFTRNDFGEDAGGSIKALASDALKRAAFRLGIGTALYTAPKIFIPYDKINLIPGSDGGLRCIDDFVVDKIVYSEDGKRIEQLVVSNDTTNQVVFVWTASEQEKRKKERMAAIREVKKTTVSTKSETSKPVKTSAAEKPVRKVATEKTPTEAVVAPVVVEETAAPAIKAEKTPTPTPPTPAMALPPLNGPEDALNTLATSGNKAGQPLRAHRPVELAFLFGGVDTPIEVKEAIKQIAAATPSVKAACIKRGYGEIAS